MKFRTIVEAMILGVMLAALYGMAMKAWGEDKPAVPVLTEVERLKVVNAWQAAIIAQVDAQNAQQRLAKARDGWNAVNTDVKAAHKWDSATTFEINSETGEVLVHLPPTKTTNPPASGTKEKQQ